MRDNSDSDNCGGTTVMVAAESCGIAAESGGVESESVMKFHKLHEETKVIF